MRKTNESLQIQTSLEKAEMRLAEAIEYADKVQVKEPIEKKPENHKKASGTKAIYGYAPELSRSSKIENDINEIDEDQKGLLKGILGEEALLKEEEKTKEPKAYSGNKTLYGYAPELSRSSKIETNINDIEQEKMELLKGILGEDIISPKVEAIQEQESDIRKQLKEELELDNDLFNEEFHSGIDALKDIAKLNDALARRTNRSIEESILGESADYEIRSFNEGNVFGEEAYEAEDIMPSEFELFSFDEEDDEIIPYAINEALILGDVVPPQYVDELHQLAEEKTDDDFDDGLGVEQINENEEVQSFQFDEKLKDAKNNLLEKTQFEAEEILHKARLDAELLLANAQREAQVLIDEKVVTALEEASDRGYKEGFEKGERDGFMAAEDAVNLGMQEEAAAFRGELEKAFETFEEKKNAILENNLHELTELAINIAEKVIKISLKSSKDVVAKMIVAAAENCRNKEWAKVYISHEDKAIAINLEKELIDALNQISTNVKVVVMEDEPSGTCIIESPDQIVDAGVATQMDNIRQIVRDSEI